MTSRSLARLLVSGVAAAFATPACDSRPVEALPPEAEGGAAGEGGTGGIPLNAAGATHSAGDGMGGEAGGPHLELDQYGCPVIPYRDADGWACSDPSVECPGEQYDCGGGPASLLRCIDGFWLYRDDESDCLTCSPGFTREGDACPDYEEGNTCELEGSGGGAGDPCEFGQSLRCEQGEWRAQEAFPAPCGEGGAGGLGSAGAAGSP
jgi:hypothetical protein